MEKELEILERDEDKIITPKLCFLCEFLVNFLYVVKIPDEMIADAKELYLKYAGRRHEQIELEMQKRGWKFYREMLYSNRRSGKLKKGLPELYGWKELLKTIKPANAETTINYRESFPFWLRQTFPEWKWEWKYQRYVYERLARLTSGKSNRLMIFMPPRHGKSDGDGAVRHASAAGPETEVIRSYNQSWRISSR